MPARVCRGSFLLRLIGILAPLSSTGGPASSIGTVGLIWITGSLTTRFALTIGQTLLICRFVGIALLPTCAGGALCLFVDLPD